MELILRRTYCTASRTIGRLWFPDLGASFCWTLEDPIRRDDPATPQDEGAKVPGATAIPAGRYRVVLTVSLAAQRGELWSPRVSGLLPELLDVPGFTGIRIHAGNTAADTRGCVLVGFGRYEDTIGESRSALAYLVDILDGHKDQEHWITIIDAGGE